MQAFKISFNLFNIINMLINANVFVLSIDNRFIKIDTLEVQDYGKSIYIIYV